MPEYTQGHDEVLAEGTYDFSVVDAIEKQSTNGNPMIELQLLVKAPGHKNGVRVFDHLTFVPNSYWKIDAFRIATGEKLVQGQTARFESEDCLDRSGRVWLAVEKYGGRSRNKVGEYIDPGAENPPPMANASPQTPSPTLAPKAEKSLEQEFSDKAADDDEIPMK